MSPEQIAEEYVTAKVIEAYRNASRMLGTTDIVVYRDAEGDLQTFRREFFLQYHPCESLQEKAEGDLANCFWYVIQLDDQVAYLNVTASVVNDVN